jgi:S-adenosylmethionine:tRNA ribosyltransferase-isomerase
MIASLHAAAWPGRREADRTPEDRGVDRDGVRLLVTQGPRHYDRLFRDLPDLLIPGDLLVVNESATLPASLPAHGAPGDFLVNLSTQYARDLWVAETRWGPGAPGPVPLGIGEQFELAGLPARRISDFPGAPRLSFVRVEGDLAGAMGRFGRPIRYGYLAREYPLATYQTIFARVPGSAEMPSAGRPFTHPLVERLQALGVRLASIVLHTGVSSLELDPTRPDEVPIYPEPFEVSPSTAELVNRTRACGGRVIAVGTTVIRALESAVESGAVRPTKGFTRLYLRPGRAVHAVDGLLTGLHDARTTHLELLASLVGTRTLEGAYREAMDRGYLWHEFGDSHLILPN